VIRFARREQPLILDYPQILKGGGCPHWVTAKGIAMGQRAPPSPIELRRDPAARNHRRDREIATQEGLRDRYEVGWDSVSGAGKPASCSSEPRYYLVGDEKDSF
jgi:hypothetical protein